MKKIIALLVITFSIFSFYSCKEDKDNTPTSKPYTNISLQDAKRYVGLDYNSVKAELEAKGYRLLNIELEYNLYGFANADTTLSYALLVNSSNIIYRVSYSKMSKNIDNTLSNYEFCKGECITEVNNSSDFSYWATNQILFGDEFYSQEEFQNYFNLNKYTMSFCAEKWESDKYLFGIEFINILAFENGDKQPETKTSTSTTSPTTPEEQTFTNPYGVGVTYIDKSLAPEGTSDKSNITKDSYLKYFSIHNLRY